MKIRQVGVPIWISNEYGVVAGLKLNNQGDPVKSGEKGYAVIEREGPDAAPDDYKIKGNKMYPDDWSALEEAGKLADKIEDKTEDKSLPYKNVLPLQSFIEEELRKAANQFGWDPGDDMQVDIELTPNAEVVIWIGPKEA